MAKDKKKETALAPSWMPSKEEMSKLPPVAQMIYKMRSKIEMALPKHITPERMIRMCLTSMHKRPKLQQCEQRSLVQSVIELSQLGLEPDTPLGHAWIVPYKREAQIIIGYKGMISLADRAGLVLSAEAVYEKDHFSYRLGTDPKIEHVPYEGPDRGALRYSYAVCQFADGRITFKVCTPAEIQRAKESSASWQTGQQNKSKRDSPWYTDEASMWIKTAVRRLCPLLPMTAELARAVQLDYEQEIGRSNVGDSFGVFENLVAEAPTIEAKLADAKEAVAETDDRVKLVTAITDIVNGDSLSDEKLAEVMIGHGVSSLKEVDAQDSKKLEAILADLQKAIAEEQGKPDLEDPAGL